MDGNEYIDFLCGYGPIILGYREDEVDDAVVRQIKDKGFCFTLTQRHQNTLAEKLTRIVPSSEMSIFLEDGLRRDDGKHPHGPRVHGQAEGHAERLPRLA